jgi:hypothetical protein
VLVLLLEKGWPSTFVELLYWCLAWQESHNAHHDGALIMMQFATMMSASSAFSKQKHI